MVGNATFPITFTPMLNPSYVYNNVYFVHYLCRSLEAATPSPKNIAEYQGCEHHYNNAQLQRSLAMHHLFCKHIITLNELRPTECFCWLNHKMTNSFILLPF